MNTAELNQHLRVHYNGPAGMSEEWITIFEARSAGFSGNDTQCDLLAINTWASRGLMRVGHEVKVSRSDWLRELKKPGKADYWWQMCHRWYLVVPKPHTAVVFPGELPEGWGLMEVSDAGKVRTVTTAPKRPKPRDPNWTEIVGWMSRLDRLDKRASAQDLAAAEQRGFERGRQNTEAARVAASYARQQEQFDTLSRNVAEFQRETGIDVRLPATWANSDLKMLPAAIRLARRIEGSGTMVLKQRIADAEERLLGTLAAYKADLQALDEAMRAE